MSIGVSANKVGRANSIMKFQRFIKLMINKERKRS